jgi:hypothetical protein
MRLELIRVVLVVLLLVTAEDTKMQSRESEDLVHEIRRSQHRAHQANCSTPGDDPIEAEGDGEVLNKVVEELEMEWIHRGTVNVTAGLGGIW